MLGWGKQRQSPHFERSEVLFQLLWCGSSGSFINCHFLFRAGQWDLWHNSSMRSSAQADPDPEVGFWLWDLKKELPSHLLFWWRCLGTFNCWDGRFVCGGRRGMPGSHLAQCGRQWCMAVIAILQNSGCWRRLEHILYNRCGYLSVHSGYIVTCVFCLPDIWGPERNPGYWCDSSSTRWKRWHYCWGMLCLFCGLLTSKCWEGFKL